MLLHARGGAPTGPRGREFRGQALKRHHPQFVVNRPSYLRIGFRRDITQVSLTRPIQSAALRHYRSIPSRYYRCSSMCHTSEICRSHGCALAATNHHRRGPGPTSFQYDRANSVILTVRSRRCKNLHRSVARCAASAFLSAGNVLSEGKRRKFFFLQDPK